MFFFMPMAIMRWLTHLLMMAKLSISFLKYPNPNQEAVSLKAFSLKSFSLPEGHYILIYLDIK